MKTLIAAAFITLASMTAAGAQGCSHDQYGGDCSDRNGHSRARSEWHADGGHSRAKSSWQGQHEHHNRADSDRNRHNREDSQRDR